LATIYQSLLFALLIFAVKQQKGLSDYFLIGFLISQACLPLHILVNFGDAFRFVALELSPNLFRLFETAYWLEGPLLLWYTRSIVYKDYTLTRTDFLFIVPAILYFIYTYFNFYQLEHSVRFEFLRDYKTLSGTFTYHAWGFVRESLRVFFSILCLIEIKHCRAQIRNRYSSLEKIDLGWLNFLVIAFLIIRVWAIFVSVALILSSHADFHFSFGTMGLIGNYTTFALVSTLIFFSLSRSTIFEGVDKIDNDSLSIEPNKSIDISVIQEIEAHMGSQKPYLANILTLEQLASQLSMSARALSNAINRHYQQNFFEFINHYRIEEAKIQLADPQHKSKTMIQVMADCGFNSKATFNTFFKKVVGSTPSQYRAAQLQGES